MKRIIPFLLFSLFVVNISYGQKLVFIDGNGEENTIKKNDKVSVPKTITDLKDITVKSPDLAAKHTLTLSANGEDQPITGNDNTKLTFSSNLLDTEITVTHTDDKGEKVADFDLKFKIVANTEPLVVTLSITKPDGEVVDFETNGEDVTIEKDVKEQKTITITCKGLPKGHSLEIEAGDETKKIKSNGTTNLVFDGNLIDKEVVIKHLDKKNNEIDADHKNFTVISDPGNGDQTDDDEDSEEVGQSIDEYLNSNYPSTALTATPFGYIDALDKKSRIIHIFFDQFGNSLLGTVPQGISNAQYMVHIIYPSSSRNANNVSYSVKQKTGSFSSALSFNNTNIRKSGFDFQSGKEADQISERRFLLGTATDDLTFDILVAEKGKKSKTILETYTIKMSPVYHGSFDIGLVRTTLPNPTYSLVDDPTGTFTVVKETDTSPRGVVTIMASFYVSPVVLFKSLFKKNNIPFYKLTGRNFLDDHKFYERIYPTIGVSISDDAFENLFYGVNWEIARGLSLFAGWHYGKVNTFEMPGYQVGVTPVTEAEFEFYQNSRWKTSGSFGVKLDAMIIRNLFGL